MERIAIYLRISTKDQSTDLQKNEILAYIKARGWASYSIFEDTGFTATNGNRPQLRRLLKAARARKIDIVVIWKLDRLFRSLKDLIITLQEFSELGIKFISLRDQLDLSTSSGRLMMHMMGAFAEFEAALVSERVKAGLNAARAKGSILGRPRTRNDSQIKLLRDQGHSIRKIANQLDCSKSAIQRSLKSGGSNG